jgi:hypothetical protein
VRARGRLHEERGELGGAAGVSLDGGGAEPQRAARVAEARRLVHVLVQPGGAPREVERRDEARQARVRGVEQRQRGAERGQRQERRRGRGRRRQRPVQVVEAARQRRVEGGRRGRRRCLLDAHGRSADGGPARSLGLAPKEEEDRQTVLAVIDNGASATVQPCGMDGFAWSDGDLVLTRWEGNREAIV